MLELKNLSYSVETEDGKKNIVDDVSLTLKENFVAFTGPNGGGKSTLAKLIMGLYKPTEGKILLNGEDITDCSVYERAKKGVCYAFQQPVRFKGITVGDLISVSSGKKLGVNEICAYLSEVGLCAREYLNRDVDTSLSGGELKRIEIASVMARGADVTLFDEPEAGIDLWSFNNLISVFEKMYQKTKGTIIIISHQERILNIADRIIVVSNGKVERDGSREEILSGILSSRTCAALSDKVR